MSMVFFFQAEDGIRDLVRSRGLGDVYKRQPYSLTTSKIWNSNDPAHLEYGLQGYAVDYSLNGICLLYTSDAADERSSVDLGGRRVIKKKKKQRKEGVPKMNISDTTKTALTKDTQR